jgi:hypothetical protein
MAQEEDYIEPRFTVSNLVPRTDLVAGHVIQYSYCGGIDFGPVPMEALSCYLQIYLQETAAVPVPARDCSQLGESYLAMKKKHLCRRGLDSFDSAILYRSTSPRRSDLAKYTNEYRTRLAVIEEGYELLISEAGKVFRALMSMTTSSTATGGHHHHPSHQEEAEEKEVKRISFHP